MQYSDIDSSRNTSSQAVAQSLADLSRDRGAMHLLHHVAERHARLTRGSVEARDLVADVIADFIAGTIERNSVPLAVQVKCAVRHRAQRYRRQVERSILVSLEDADEATLIDESNRAAHLEADASANHAALVVQSMRVLARDDMPALQLLELHGCGRSRRLDARSTGMSPSVYRGARERLSTYATRAVAVVQAAEDEASQVASMSSVARVSVIADASHRAARSAPNARRTPRP
jgi:hypothetical protein